ncbi:MAG: ligase-associated DNA damage response exonuclease [Flavobacteriaceae bacterium]|nr:ligase-associated DNA damage response exonuclease [Flavobacteriaceae bacterium]
MHRIKAATDLLVFTKKGIYCPLAGVYLDPWQKVDKALVSHAHTDHARWGNGSYIGASESKELLKHRLGAINLNTYDYAEPFKINGVEFCFFPAGHIPGSAQIRVRANQQTWVYSGDYKIHEDGISRPFIPVKCDTFITESTFALPVFQWQTQESVFESMRQWCMDNHEQGVTSVLLGYALGKAQRILAGIKELPLKIFTHGAVQPLNELLQTSCNLPTTYPITATTTQEETRGQIIIAPPSAQNTAWLKKRAPYKTAFVSGWMQLRGTRRRRSVDKGFVLSDHADWKEILEAVKATGCERVITTHGYQNELAQYLTEIGYQSTAHHSLFNTEEEQ